MNAGRRRPLSVFGSRGVKSSQGSRDTGTQGRLWELGHTPVTAKRQRREPGHTPVHRGKPKTESSQVKASQGKARGQPARPASPSWCPATSSPAPGHTASRQVRSTRVFRLTSLLACTADSPTHASIWYRRSDVLHICTGTFTELRRTSIA